MSSKTEALNQRILVIDSNVFFARRLTEALKALGFDVVHSTQASYALTMLEWQAPTAILCATNLREIECLMICRRYCTTMPPLRIFPSLPWATAASRR